MALGLTGTTVTLNGNAQQLSGLFTSPKFVNVIRLQHNTSANASLFYGGSAITTTNAWGVITTTSDTAELRAPAGSYIDLGSIYLLGTNNNIIRIAAL
jgi:hypothetical protein